MSRGEAGVSSSTADRDDAGFSMVEVLVALTLFGFLAGTVAVSLTGLLQQTKHNQERVVAAALASRVIDRLHAVPATQLPEGPLPVQTFAIDGKTFTVTAAASLVAEGDSTGAGACDGSDGNRNAKRINVAVTWPDMGRTKPVRTDTLRQLTVGELDPTKGVLSVRMVDASNAPAVGHTVTVYPVTWSAVTGADGCVVFRNLDPGSYTVRPYTAGYVDPVGNATPMRSVTVVAGALTKDPGFRYDRAGTLSVGWVAPGDTASTYPLLPGTGVTLANSAFSGGRISLPVCGIAPCTPSGSAGSWNVPSLFPATDGYTAWAGTCALAQPGSSSAATVLAPGGTGTFAARVARVTIVAGKANSTVKITHGADGGCPAGVATTVSTGSGSTTTNVALPKGTWTFQVGTNVTTTVTLDVGSPPVTVTVAA